MTVLDAPSLLSQSEILSEASRVLSGKRIALVGFSAAAAEDLASIIGEAEAFTRALSPEKIEPSSDVLRPFELILLNLEAAAGTAWLQTENLAGVADRCIAVGEWPVLLQSACTASPAFKEYWTCSPPAGELLLRCVLALRSPRMAAAKSVAASSTVVLADDDTSVTSIVRRALERNGMTCEIAANGREALELITKVKPCAAILDVHMPAMDGFEILSKIKSVPELNQTRVLLLTGCEQEADVIRGFTLGADDYLCKPFNPMELTIRLMRAIGRI